MKALSFLVVVATGALVILVLATVSWPVRDPELPELEAKLKGAQHPLELLGI